MKNIKIQVKNILNTLKFNIKILIIEIILTIAKVIAFILYIFWTVIYLIQNKSMLKLIVISTFYTIKYKVVYFIKYIINKIKNINKILFIYFSTSTLYNNKLVIINNRLN